MDNVRAARVQVIFVLVALFCFDELPEKCTSPAASTREVIKIAPAAALHSRIRWRTLCCLYGIYYIVVCSDFDHVICGRITITSIVRICGYWQLDIEKASTLYRLRLVRRGLLVSAVEHLERKSTQQVIEHNLCNIVQLIRFTNIN